MSPPPSPTEEIDASLSSPSSSRRPAIAFTSPRAKPPPKVARKLDFNDDADESEDEAMRYSSPLKRKTAPPRMPPVDLEPAPRAPPRVFHGPQLPSPPAKRTYAPTGRDAALDGLRAYNPTAHHQHAPRLDDRRAPRPPVQRYTVAQPAPLSPPADAGVTIDEVPANWANVPAVHFETSRCGRRFLLLRKRPAGRMKSIDEPSGNRGYSGYSLVATYLI